MRIAATAAASALAVLGLVAPAARAAGDPTMPLADVKVGMKCKAYTVVQGTSVDSFNADVVEIVDGSGGYSARIMVVVSGPAVDSTGVGPGFSGSPIYCPGADGTMRNAGAISESIGEYGGKVVLVTPIEAILGEKVDPPAEAKPSSAAAFVARRMSRPADPAARRAAAPRTIRDDKVLPLAAPLSVSGLSPNLSRALIAAGKKAGRLILAAPPASRDRYPVTPFRPGSAFGVGLTSGDLAVGATGTVAYVDGDVVWGFGHPYEGLGRRGLLLQDAYVYRVINNPNASEAGTTYKLAANGHDVGTVTNDALESVVGRVGGLPRTIPVRLYLKDGDTGAERQFTVAVADEVDLGQPAGTSGISFVAPLAVAQSASTLLRGSPSRQTAEMCLRIAIQELGDKPIRVCNRYVGIGAASEDGTGATANAMASDVLEALAIVDAYKFADLHITEVSARITIKRGAKQAFIKRATLPRSVRPGQRVPVTLLLERVRGTTERVRFRMTVPAGVRPGLRTFTLTGTDADTGSQDLLGTITLTLGEEEDAPAGGDPGPRTLGALRKQLTSLKRYDGVGARFGGRSTDEFGNPVSSRPVFRATDLRISGTTKVRVRVARGSATR